MFYGFLLFAFLNCEKASAQMVQYGKVVELNTKGKTISGVAITVQSAHDCHPTASDAHGLFRLSFAEHQIGDVIHGLRAKKYGYEVVNIHVTRDGWTLTDRDTLRIVMAPSGKINEARMRYYDLIETACVGLYDSTMALLNEHYANHIITLPEYQYWKLQAENELQHAYHNMDIYADVFARIDDEEEDIITQAVSSKLNANDILGAIALASGVQCETVLQSYSDFYTTFPLESHEEMETKAVLDSLQVSDTLYEEIMVLQTYANLFESDFVVSGEKYAKSCAYLGVIYKDKDWTEASTKYLQKALRMYEMLNLIDGVEVEDKIEKIKKLLEKQ